MGSSEAHVPAIIHICKKRVLIAQCVGKPPKKNVLISQQMDDGSQAGDHNERATTYHNKPAFFKDGWPTEEVRDKQSRIMKIQGYITNKIITDNNYRPSTDDEDQPLRDEMDKLRKELGIR